MTGTKSHVLSVFMDREYPLANTPAELIGADYVQTFNTDKNGGTWDVTYAVTLGEMAVLSGEPRSATVTAVKNTELLELTRADLQRVCSRHPEVEAKLRLAYEERRTMS